MREHNSEVKSGNTMNLSGVSHCLIWGGGLGNLDNGKKQKI